MGDSLRGCWEPSEMSVTHAGHVAAVKVPWQLHSSGPCFSFHAVQGAWQPQGWINPGVFSAALWDGKPHPGGQLSYKDQHNLWGSWSCTRICFCSQGVLGR